VKLFDTETPEEVFAHPRHQAAQTFVAELIAKLRACATVQHGYELQNDLLRLRLAVEADRRAFQQAVKRVKARRQPHVGAPIPQSGLDPVLLEMWELEVEVCNRVIRRLLCAPNPFSAS
jgi:hypothetical protein